MVAPIIVQDDRTTHGQGFSTLQSEQQEKEDTIDTVCDDNTRNKRDKLSMLYAKGAKRQDMNLQDYCRYVLPNKSICIKFSCFVWAYQTYNVCKLCILYRFFEWYFVRVLFCLCFVYKLHFHPLWDQYTDSIVNPLHMCLFGVVPVTLSSLIFLLDLFCTLCNQCCQSKPIGGIDLL